MDKFRAIDELKYKLMPYVYAQAKDSSDHGLAMVRALFVEFPNDPGSWQIDDEYLYGSQILVAPLMHAGETSRDVYLPPGTWIDYQTGNAYSGGWQKIEAGKIPEIILVRDGTAIPHLALAQSTAQMDWSKIELVVFAKDTTTAKGLLFLPGDSAAREVTLTKSGESFKLDPDPLAGKVAWKISLGKAVQNEIQK
jgi:alpha-D-xyloside xylohydrolase